MFYSWAALRAPAPLPKQSWGGGCRDSRQGCAACIPYILSPHRDKELMEKCCWHGQKQQLFRMSHTRGERGEAPRGGKCFTAALSRDRELVLLNQGLLHNSEQLEAKCCSQVQVCPLPHGQRLDVGVRTQPWTRGIHWGLFSPFMPQGQVQELLQSIVLDGCAQEKREGESGPRDGARCMC